MSVLFYISCNFIPTKFLTTNKKLCSSVYSTSANQLFPKYCTPLNHLFLNVEYCIALYLFASIESHYITLDMSIQYTYHANKQIKTQIKHKHSTVKCHHMTRTVYKIMSIWVITVPHQNRCFSIHNTPLDYLFLNI